MIFAYNKEQVGDVLLVILEDTKDVKRSVERKGKVARVTADETGKTLAWNIFEASSLIDIKGNGQVFLSDQDVAVLNEELAKELADIIHYTVAIAAINDIDLTKTIFEKDKTAAVKYQHERDLEQFIADKSI